MSEEKEVTEKNSENFNETKERLKVEDIKKIEVTYINYIKTKELLSLQTSEVKNGLHHHDEHLFIVVHQSFELWFKQILHELDSIKDIMEKANNDFSQKACEVISHRLKRTESILKYSLGTFDILESMHPIDFLEFRDYIGPASVNYSLKQGFSICSTQRIRDFIWIRIRRSSIVFYK
jgi:tryptophan 2,3-dioxygenase